MDVPFPYSDPVQIIDDNDYLEQGPVAAPLQHLDVDHFDQFSMPDLDNTLHYGQVMRHRSGSTVYGDSSSSIGQVIGAVAILSG